MNVPEASSLPNPNSLLRLHLIFQENSTISDAVPDGFTVSSQTENPLTEENTFDLLIDPLDGNISLILTVDYEEPPPSNTGFNGNITVNHDGPAYQIYILVRADGTERYNDTPTNFTTTTFSIGTQLLSESSYLYMSVFPSGSYGISSSGFEEEGVIYIGNENIGGTLYQKYSISSTLTNATLVYNIETYDDD